MSNELSFKELYEVSLKATYPIEVGENVYEIGETIISFDRVQLANFQEIKSQASSQGGYDNRSLIIWDETKELRLNFSQGIFSKSQFALMTNAQLFAKEADKLLIDKRVERETNELGQIFLDEVPVGSLFVYNKKTGKKILNWTLTDNILTCAMPFEEVVVDYQYVYKNNYQTLRVGEALTQGYLSLTGKMRIKDGVTGQVTTGIIRIPKLKLMSDLSMRLGADAIPQVGRFDAVALPVGGKGNKKVMEIIFLEDDVDSDM